MTAHTYLRITIVTAVFCITPLALAKPAPKAASPAVEAPVPETPVDVSSVREQMKVLTDGKKHYLVVAPYNKGQGGVFSDNGQSEQIGFFAGDGKTFYIQRTGGGGSKKNLSYWYAFWDPRATRRDHALYEFEKGKHIVTCSDRKTELQEVPEAEAKAILDGAKFVKPLWKRKAYWLARDERANYYYVDVMREATNKQFRLFVGPKGNLKLQKMTNVVSDSKGDIFSTKAGELRLITQDNAGAWIAGEKKLPLTLVPVEDNGPLIYTDLGVYAGEKLGTPCDDF